MRHYPMLVSFLCLIACQSNTPAIQDDKKAKVGSNEIEVELFQNEDNSWGYNVNVNSKRFIHQPNIPAIQGHKGFNSGEEAKQVAQLVVYKVENKIIPPGISLEELDSLNISY